MFTFSGSNTLITIDSGVSSFSAAELYSRWKEWVILSDNAKFLPAFSSSIGGQPLGGGVFLGSYFFLQTQNGWRIRPPEEDVQITVSGNLYSQEVAVSLFIPTVGDFNTIVRLQTSNLTQAISTTGGSGACTWNSEEKNSAISNLELTKDQATIAARSSQR